MERIRKITDREILGNDEISHAVPRVTVRVIVRNRYGHLAVMYNGKHGYHSLPGGGVEDGEALQFALRREIAEETGCSCDAIQSLGYIEENRGYCDYTQISYYYVVDTDSETLTPHLTDTELENGTAVDWYASEEAYRLIADAKHTTPQKMYLQARDVAALNAYLLEK